MAKKKLYIEPELEWVENEVAQLKWYLESINIATVKDRYIMEGSEKRPVIKLVAKEEEIVKAYFERMRDLAELLAILNTLRSSSTNEKKGIGTRGDIEKSMLMLLDEEENKEENE